jgi:hypothetical protein
VSVFEITIDGVTRTNAFQGGIQRRRLWTFDTTLSNTPPRRRKANPRRNSGAG